MRVLHCQNCGKAGLAVFQATTPGRPTLMPVLTKDHFNKIYIVKVNVLNLQNDWKEAEFYFKKYL